MPRSNVRGLWWKPFRAGCLHFSSTSRKQGSASHFELTALPVLPAGYFWTRCPTEAGSVGCEVASFTANASPQIVPARTCLLSYDGTKDQAAYFTMQVLDGGW